MDTKRWRSSIVCLFVLLTVLAPAHGQKKRKRRPGRLPRELRKALVPGLSVRFQSVATKETATRVRRMAALFVPRRGSPTAALSPGRFKATFQGYIKLKLKGDYRFHFVGKGQAKLVINKKVVATGDLADLATAKKSSGASLVRGYNRIMIEYLSPMAGDSKLRVYWTGPEFPREPIPPAQLFTDGRGSTLKAHNDIYGGRALFANRQCVVCHKTVATGRGAMPELNRDAPDLTHSAGRIAKPWIHHWLLAPTSLRRRATMPHMLGGLEKSQASKAAADIAEYLTQRVSQPAANLRPGNATKGEILYEDLGCITCHRFTPPKEEDDGMDRLSLYFANAKFRLGALRSFLKSPRAHYKWSRMPAFKLSDVESANLAAHIRKNAKGRLPAVGKGSISRGGTLVKQLGCYGCHRTRRQPFVAAQVNLFSSQARLDKGCLARQPAGNVPNYRLTPQDRRRMLAFLKEGAVKLLERRVDVEFAQRSIRLIRCNSCHNRDGQTALFPYVLSEEGTQGHPPEAIPSLTWAGEKLRAQWMVDLFSGRLTTKTRPHIRARMPSFPVRGLGLAVGLTSQHGFLPNEDARPVFDQKQVAIGKRLAAMNSGMSCNRCHPIGSVQPLAPFDARSTNFSQVGKRLRYEYYRRWMLHPQRVDPTTKMLKFAPDGKRTSLTSILDGNAERQFEALWHYLMELQEKSGRPGKGKATRRGKPGVKGRQREGE